MEIDRFARPVCMTCGATVDEVNKHGICDECVETMEPMLKECASINQSLEDLNALKEAISSMVVFFNIAMARKAAAILSEAKGVTAIFCDPKRFPYIPITSVVSDEGKSWDDLLDKEEEATEKLGDHFYFTTDTKIRKTSMVKIYERNDG